MNNSKKYVLTGKILLYLLPIMALIIIPLFFFDPDLALLGSYIAFPMLFAPILYLIYYRRHDVPNIGYEIKMSDRKYPVVQNRLFLILLILYFLCISVSIILLTIYDTRPIIYYGIITIIATIILFEILSFEISYGKTIIVLVQIMILVLDILWGVTLKYDFFISRTDPLAHVWFIENLISQGYVTDTFGMYQQFPLWHIMVAISYKILDISIPIQKMMFFINGLNYAILMLAIFLLSSKIFDDNRLALLSALFAAINSNIISSGMRSIPRSVIVLFAVILILSLDSDIKKKFLAIILTFIMIVYHTVSMPFIISILLIIYLFKVIYNVEYNKIYIYRDYLLLAVIATLTYWIFYANDIFGMVIRDIFNPAITGIMTKSVVYTPLNEFFNYLQYFPLLFFVIFGVLLTLGSNIFSEFEKVFSISMLLIITVAIPGPGLLFNILSSSFNLERFGEYSHVFIIMVGAIGFVGMYQIIGKKLKIIAIILFITMSFLSVSNDFSASDNPLVNRVFYTFYLNEKEIIEFNNIANFTEGFVLSDYVVKRYLWFSQYKSKAHLLEVNQNLTILRNNNSDIILIRNQELNKRPLKFFQSRTNKFKLNPDEKGSLDYYYQNSPLWNSLEKYNKIYDGGRINGFN